MWNADAASKAHSSDVSRTVYAAKVEAIVVSPLDPDWQPDGGAESGAAAAAAEPFFATATPGMAPPSSVPLAPPAPSVPMAPPAAQLPPPPVVAPQAQMPPAPMAAPAVAPAAPTEPLAIVAPALPEQPAAPASEAAPAATSASSDAAYTRSALEEDSELEAGLLTELLIEVLDRNASDLHLTAGARPTIRMNGSLEQLDDRPIMTPPVIQRMMYAVLTQKQREKFEE